MIELPVLPATPMCGAAIPVRGAMRSQQGVICTLMRDAGQDHAGTGVSPGALERVRDSPGGVYLNLKSDPSTVLNFCHGPGLPVVSEEGRSPSYTCCPVWQAKRDREIAGKRGLVEEREPDPVSMGVTAVDEDRVRRGLEELVRDVPGDGTTWV